MPRKVRTQSKNGIYHVMLRGNERKNLFLDDEDKQSFINTFKRLMRHEHANKDKNEKKFFIYAYCLMDNHIHILINQGEDTISRIIKRIGTSYAYYFNKKYSRIGHLFQDRFKSEPIENDSYLLAVTRYIHNNPVKAGIADLPFQYRWSSYIDYIDDSRTDDFVETSSVLDIFSMNKHKAKELFKEFSQQNDSDVFIDYNESFEEKVLKNRKDVERFIESYLLEKGLKREELNDVTNRAVRNQMICELKEKSNLSIRQIADTLRIDRGIIQRIKKLS